MLEHQVVIPAALRDILPDGAQEIYIKTYQQSWEQFKPNGLSALSQAGIAARDAWAAVTREYVQDEATHQWYRKGEQPKSTSTHKSQSAFDFLRRIFGRSQ